MDTRLVSVARGDSPADLVLANSRIVNVFTGETMSGDVAIYGDRIAGIGNYPRARRRLDLRGRYLAPGLIDGHTHIESSMLSLSQYARAVVPRGTTAVVTDLHEIANVCGLPGMRHVLDSARRLPLDVFLMAPSGVPASDLETSGARLGVKELRHILRWKRCIGLGEVMNYEGVVQGDAEMAGKLALFAESRSDGHAPGLRSEKLNAYISVGIYSDHESVSATEAREKLERGMYVMIREGSSEKNLEALLPLVNEGNARRFMLVVDDRSCEDLLEDGEVDGVVRKAIKLGLDPVRAIQMGTLNPSEYFRLNGRGAVAPGYRADLVVIGDLSSFRVDMVFYAGRLVAEEGKAMFPASRRTGHVLNGTMHIKPFGVDALRLTAREDTRPVIQIVPGQIITRRGEIKVRAGEMVSADTSADILKLAVVERHRATGNIGLGLIRGFGLKRGALASSISHDSHNVVCVGVEDADIYTAVKEVERLQGGLVAAAGGRVLASLPLPDAGLLSDEPLESVVASLKKLEQAARELGSRLPAPFATLSFMALPVIPELRLTDRGMVDVNRFELIPD